MKEANTGMFVAIGGVLLTNGRVFNLGKKGELNREDENPFS
jgi:hypothetical protein